LDEALNLYASLPFGNERREEALSVARILVTVQNALNRADRGGLSKMAGLAEPFLQRRQAVWMLREGLHKRAVYLAKKELAFEECAFDLTEEFFELLATCWPGLSDLLDVSDARDVRSLLEEEDLRERVEQAILKSLQRAGWDLDLEDEDHAERWVTGAFIALGVDRNKARGLFRFEDQRVKREATTKGNPEIRQRTASSRQHKPEKGR
jgi:hypothetical protein